MNRVRLALVLLTVLTGSAAAQTAFGPIAGMVRTQRFSLPPETPLVSLNPSDKEFPRQTYVLKRTFAEDGTFTCEWRSLRYLTTQIFRVDGTLLWGKQTDLSRGVSVETRSDPGRTTLRTVVTTKSVVKSDKMTSLTAGIALREELQYLNIQAWASGIRNGLSLQSLSPDGGLVGDFKIVFQRVSDPTTLSDKYAYPAEFRAALSVQPYIVADMSLQGFGAFFFPHHFYLVYVETPEGLRFAAYFGEDPKNPVFQYVPR